MRFMKTHGAKALPIGFVGAVALSVSLAAMAAPTSLRFGHPSQPDPARGPYADAPHQFEQALQKLLPGQFELKVYPNRQLGDEKEMLEQVRFGTLDMVVTTNAVVANIEPSMLLNDLPFLYPDRATAHRFLDGPVGMRMLAGLEDKNLVGLAFFEGGYRHMMNNAHPIATPGDVKGVKFRVMQNPVYVSMFDALGGNAIPMAFGDLFTALRQGTVDGMELPVTAAYAVKANEVTKFLSLTNHTYSALVMSVSKRTFDKLTPDQRKAFREAALTANKAQRENNAKREEAATAALEKAGMTVNAVESAAEFRTLVKPVYEKFRDRIGADFLDAALEATGK